MKLIVPFSLLIFGLLLSACSQKQLLKAETVQQGLATIRRIECKNIPTVGDPSVVGNAASTA